jgi:hypothetical protein
MSAFGRRRTRPDELLGRYCRRRFAGSAVIERCRTATTMSSFHYSTPDPLPTRVLVDMIVFYSTPDLRAELMNDETLVEEIAAETAETIATWTPSTSWERSIVSHGRHIQWLVWKTTNARDDSMREIYTDLDDVIAPWLIDIETLPDYRQQLPAPTLRDDVD